MLALMRAADYRDIAVQGALGLLTRAGEIDKREGEIVLLDADFGHWLRSESI